MRKFNYSNINIDKLSVIIVLYILVQWTILNSFRFNQILFLIKFKQNNQCTNVLQLKGCFSVMIKESLSNSFWDFFPQLPISFKQFSFCLGEHHYTRVMTFREAGWNRRIFFFRAREALMRQADGSGRGSCCRGRPAAVGPIAASAHTRPPSSSWLSKWSSSSRDRLLSESDKDWKLWLDSLSPKRLVVLSLISPSLLSAIVEWNKEAHSAEYSDSHLGG